MIDRGDIRQAIDRCSNIWASLPGYCGQFEQALIPGRAAPKRSEVERLDMTDNGARGHQIIPAWVICIIVCPSWAVNHYRDNAITYKAQRDKNARELEAGERGNY